MQTATTSPCDKLSTSSILLSGLFAASLTLPWQRVAAAAAAAAGAAGA